MAWWQSGGVSPVARWHVKRERGVTVCPLAIAADGKRLACVSASGVDSWNLEAGSIGPTFGAVEKNTVTDVGEPW